MKRIRIDAIGFDPHFYPRVAGHTDWVTVHKYTSALKANPSLAFGWSDDRAEKGFPPVHVAKATAKEYVFILLDGKHRLAAYHRAGLEEIPAFVEALPESKWLRRSSELNLRHGRPLDAGDKAWVIERLKDDGESEDDIATLLQMTVPELQRISAKHVVRMSAKISKNIPQGRSHRTINSRHIGFLKAPFLESVGSSAITALQVQEPVSAHSALQVLLSACSVLEVGVDMEDEEVAEAVARLKELLS